MSMTIQRLGCADVPLGIPHVQFPDIIDVAINDAGHVLPVAWNDAAFRSEYSQGVSSCRGEIDLPQTEADF